MIIRLGYLTNYFLQRDIAGRTLYKLPEDIFLVAYPGSEGQWLRRLIANLIDPSKPVKGTDVLSRLPDLYHLSRRDFAKIPSPRIIFSHECFDAEYSKVAYLVRDPRDVAVSFYEQGIRGGSIDRSVSIEQFVATSFMRTDEYQGGWSEEFSGSIESNRGFAYRSRLKDEFLGTPASWGENVMSWIGARGLEPSLLLVRYEDLFADPGKELARIADFLPLEGVPGNIESAVRTTQSQATPGAPGKWRTVLPEAAVKAIESEWGRVMTAIGYELAAGEIGEDKVQRPLADHAAAQESESRK